MKEIRITLNDPREPENTQFANLVDPVLLSIFIERLKDTSEKRSVQELVEALLNGQF